MSRYLAEKNTPPAVWDWDRLGGVLQKVAARCAVAVESLHVFILLKAVLSQGGAIPGQASMVQTEATCTFNRDLCLLVVVLLLQKL